MPGLGSGWDDRMGCGNAASGNVAWDYVLEPGMAQVLEQ